MRWLKDHLWLVAIAFLGVLAFVVAVVLRLKNTGSLKDLAKELKLEKQVIDEKAKTAKLVAEKGRDEALATIRKQHEDRVAKMDDADKKKVEELANDPEALVEHLLRATV